uniref:Ig-like domain-containing protein n=1 Tax=Electrophorus electricus TaxID=8005 RepID=A0A4W4GIW2_ELEEL
GLSPPVSLIISPSRTQHFRGDSLSLSCEGQSDSPGWRVRGYTHNGSVSDCSSFRGSVTGSRCTIGYLYTSHTGVYWCQSESGGSSNPVNITVHSESAYLPTTTLTVEPQSPVFTGESVTLKCEVQGYVWWTYQWYKKKAQSQWTTVSQSVFDTVNRDTLTISGDAVVNGDQYQCRGARNNRPTSHYSNTVTLTVHAVKPTPELTSSLTGAALVGNPVTLHCKLDQSAGWSFYWSRHTQNPENETNTATNSYTISSVAPSDGGQYWCRAGRGNPVLGVD